MLPLIVFLGLVINANCLAPYFSGFLPPSSGPLTHGQSCQYFKNGHLYQGPCEQKPGFGSGIGEVNPFGPSHIKKEIGVIFPSSGGYDGWNGNQGGYGGGSSGKPGGFGNKPNRGYGSGGGSKPGGFGTRPNGGYGGSEGGEGGNGWGGKPSGGHGGSGHGGKPGYGSGGGNQGGYKPGYGGGIGKPGGFGSKPNGGNKPGYGGGSGKPGGFGNKPDGGYGSGIGGGDGDGIYGGSKPGYGGGGKPGGFGNKPNGGYGGGGVFKGGHGKCTTNDGLEGICSPLATCFYQFDDISDLEEHLCEKSSHLPKVCCPIDGHREVKIKELPITIPKEFHYRKVDLSYISIDDIDTAARDSIQIVKNNLELEKRLVEKGLIQTPNSMEARHQAFFGGPDKFTRITTKNGLVALETTIQLAKKFELSKDEARDGLGGYSLLETSAHQFCPKEPHCKRDFYRTIDGSCNNLENPLWGMSHTVLNRIVPPDYADGLNEPRKASDGSDLPGARTVSTTLATDIDIPEVKFTLLVMQWGQFIDHDLTLTASTRIDSDRGEGIICCREEFARNPSIRHPACRPIYIPDDDEFYSKYEHQCNNFVRNSPSPRAGCKLGPREQSNTLTHYLDGSMIYGSTEERANHLRSFVKGQLKNTIINGVEYLPFDSANKSDECAIPEERRLKCFVGGDVRVNEQTGLTVLHMLWLREHNRIAYKLNQLNPSWNDETIYQEARRIVAAITQHIHHSEWTPLILGRRVMKEFGLFPKASGYLHEYNPKVNPGILNAFATAAYRFHTLIQGVFRLMNNFGKITNKLQLRNLFNNPESLYPRGAFDEFINCLSGQPTQTFDQHFTQELTNHLFQERERQFGMDLISLNIQRGRDHGLPGYNHFRKACGQHPIKSFQELSQVMRKGSAERMAKIYKSVDDIDLFIAGNHERPLPGAVVGPTFACILAEQARRVKYGDRFWYENGDMDHSFSKEQLDEIRKTSFASVFCANSDGVDKMQPLALIQPSELNPKIPCSEIPQMSFEPWGDEYGRSRKG